MIMDNRNNAAADFFELILSTLWMVNLIYFSDKSLSRISKYRKNIRLIVERLNVTVDIRILYGAKNGIFTCIKCTSV